MSVQPLISIICPLYNKKKYIEETIDSVIDQTYRDWEMIIVDDGSTDGSCELVDELCRAEPRIHLYRRTDFKQNKGGSVCRNIGIDLSKGRFILFLDADDLLKENCLEERIKRQTHFPGKDMYIFSESYFKLDINHVVKRGSWNWLDRVLYKISTNKKKYFLKRFLKYYLPFQTSCVLWSAAALKTIGGFDERFERLQDPEIHTKALLQKNITIKSFLFFHSPDVYIRLDEQRHIRSIGSSQEKYLSFVKSSEQFVSKFTDDIVKTGQYPYLTYLNVHLSLIEININNAMIPCAPADRLYYKDLKAEIRSFRAAQQLPSGRIMQGLINLHEYLVTNRVFRKMKIPTLVALLIVYSGSYLK